MNKTIHRKVITCVALFAFSMHGSGILAQPVTMYDAVSNAVSNYPLIKQREAELQAARAHIRSVNGTRLPSLTLHDQLSAGSDNSLQGAYFSMGMIPSTPGSYTAINSKPNPGNTAISFLRWDIVTFGYYSALHNEAVASAAIENANLDNDKYQLTGKVVYLYLEWLKKYRLLQTERQNLKRAELIMNAITATVRSGLKPGVDSSTASATFSNARLDYLRSREEFEACGIDLAAYTGLNNTNMTPDTTVLTDVNSIGKSLNISGDSIGADNPMLNVFKRRYEWQLVNYETNSRKYLPHIGLDAAAWVRSSGIMPDGTYPSGFFDGMPNSKYNYLAAMTVTYNLFDLKRRHDENAEGRYRIEASGKAVHEQEVLLRKVMLEADNAYRSDVEKMGEMPSQLRAARQAYEQQLVLYRSGLNTLIEVTNAQYALLQAEANFVLVQDELLKAAYMKAALSGNTGIFLQQFKH